MSASAESSNYMFPHLLSDANGHTCTCTRVIPWLRPGLARWCVAEFRKPASPDLRMAAVPSVTVGNQRAKGRTASFRSA